MKAIVYMKRLSWLSLTVIWCVNAQLGNGDPDNIITNNKRTIDTNSGAAFISILGKSSTKHPAHLADFGSSLMIGKRYKANLMLPPQGYDTLCEFPKNLENVTSPTQTNNIFESTERREIALFVRRGGCSFDQKARIALQIQGKVNPLVQFMVVYNQDPERPQDLIIMSTNATGQALQHLHHMSFIFVSYMSGMVIMGRINDELQQDSSHSPRIKPNSNTTWYLPIIIDAFTPSEMSSPDNDSQPPSTPNGNNNFRRSTDSATYETFHWLRFVFFSLLIISPCVRAAYLWYSAGGRILIRRNEQGRTIGLLYIRPMPFWFVNATEEGSGTSSGAQVSDCLTEEEVKDLPDLAYKPPNDEKQTAEDAPVTLDTTNHSSRSSVDNPSEIPLSSKPGDLELVSLGQSASQPTTKSDLYTTCTMCSICIDDFEEGENILVLPKCKHGFHRECITPWLTERHGCCPLCKTLVVGGNVNGNSGGNVNGNGGGGGGGGNGGGSPLEVQNTETERSNETANANHNTAVSQESVPNQEATANANNPTTTENTDAIV